ncbi:MAG: transglutaminase [Verrucomicrobia bacterium]|nr:MAG: transglutaminase [Verrucomicrobiota bacterium]
MLIRIGYDISFELGNSTPLVVMLYLHPSRRDDLESPEEIKVEPNLPVHTYLDGFGNVCGRLLAPPGTVRFSLDTRIRDNGEPDPEVPEAIQHNVEDLPDETLRFLLPSRYCEVDKLNDEAWRLFGSTRPGWSITFGYHFADPQKSALEVYRDGKGVCRDFMHLAVTFCRCLNIPARYVTGYLGDIGVPPAPYPMDFSAWFEVFLGDKWHAFDARHNQRRIGRILMAVGRDAADVALTTNFGSAKLIKFEVVTEEVK